LYNETATLPQKWVKGDLRIFHLNVARLSLFRKTISRFSYVAPFGYNNAANKGTVNFFGEIWGNFPISPKTGGRGDDTNHRILKPHHTPTVRKKNSRAVHSLFLGSNGE